MMVKRMLWILAALFIFPYTVTAQEDAVVYAVLFYSPTCPHCHQVIDNDLPPLQEKYGDQLQILFINVTVQGGRELFRTACETLAPNGNCGGVPTMIVGSTVMVGSYEIPTQLPDLIENGLASGGIGLPAIPGLQEAYNLAIQNQQVEEETTESNTSQPETNLIQTEAKETTWQDRFKDDPTANGIAVGVLVLLILSTAALLVTFYRTVQEKRVWSFESIGWVVLLVALLAAVIAGTLVLEQEDFSAPTLLAMIITGGLLLVAGTVWNSRHEKYSLPNWILPLVAVLGLLVAGYMVYVEVGENDAVCGAVGDCNTVQQSDYANFLGLIPIGVLGIIGYIMILAAWYLTQQDAQMLVMWGRMAVFGLTLFGAVFSIYLTFLEPFVIGATCAWCLTSAMLMLLLLWLQARTGLETIQTFVQSRRGAVS